MCFSFLSHDDDDDEGHVSEWKYNALCVSVHALDFLSRLGVFVQVLSNIN